MSATTTPRYVYYARTRAGKSRRGAWLAGAPRYVWVPDQLDWFDGYEGQPHVLFEEFRGQSSLASLLVLTDRYTARDRVKNAFTQFSARRIAFTLPRHPNLWFPDFRQNEYFGQLMRRISLIVDVSALEEDRVAIEHEVGRTSSAVIQMPASGPFGADTQCVAPCGGWSCLCVAFSVLICHVL